MTFIELYQIVVEMLEKTGASNPSLLDDVKQNNKAYRDILAEQKKYKRYKISKYKSFDLYFSDILGKWDFTLLDHQTKQIVLEVTIKKYNSFNAYVTDSIWKKQNVNPNLMQEFFYDVLLQTFPVIQSRESHTDPASDFWLKLIKTSIPLGYKCSYVYLDDGDMKEFILDTLGKVEDMQYEIWSSIDYRVRIYAK